MKTLLCLVALAAGAMGAEKGGIRDAKDRPLVFVEARDAAPLYNVKSVKAGIFRSANGADWFLVVTMAFTHTFSGPMEINVKCDLSVNGSVHLVQRVQSAYIEKVKPDTLATARFVFPCLKRPDGGRMSPQFEFSTGQ